MQQFVVCLHKWFPDVWTTNRFLNAGNGINVERLLCNNGCKTNAECRRFLCTRHVIPVCLCFSGLRYRVLRTVRTNEDTHSIFRYWKQTSLRHFRHEYAILEVILCRGKAGYVEERSKIPVWKFTLRKSIYVEVSPTKSRYWWREQIWKAKIYGRVPVWAF